MVVLDVTDDDTTPGTGPLQFTEVPVPDHLASMGDSEPAPAEPSSGRPKRRILPGAGSRDSGPRAGRRADKAPRERKPLPPIPRNGFAPDIEKLYVMLGMGFMPFDVELSGKLVEIAPAAGEAWDELARKNEVVRRALVALLETGAWGKVFAAHAPLFALAFARLTGESVRVTFAASQLGQEAETHANRHRGNGQG
jgi:hypothetical protein